LRPQASEGEAQHGHFAGLDVSVKETSICIVDDTGRIVREVKAASEPEEAGPLSQWLFSALAEAVLAGDLS
jgi:transposase